LEPPDFIDWFFAAAPPPPPPPPPPGAASPPPPVVFDGELGAGAAAFPFLALFFPIAVICIPVRPWCRRLKFDDFTSSKWCCFPPKNTEEVSEEKELPVVVIFSVYFFRLFDDDDNDGLLMKRVFVSNSLPKNLKKCLSLWEEKKASLVDDVGNEKENVFEKKYHRCETYYYDHEDRG